MNIKYVELNLNNGAVVGMEWFNITYSDLPRNAVRCSLYTQDTQYLYFYSDHNINGVMAKNFHFAHLKGQLVWKPIQLHVAKRPKNEKAPHKKG